VLSRPYFVRKECMSFINFIHYTYL
jgi:hypothetical protein